MMVYYMGMAEKSLKKFNTLAILMILSKYGDKDHPLTHKRLIELLKEQYNVILNRKTVSDCIYLLDKVGFSISEQPKKGFYLEHPFLGGGDAERAIESLFVDPSLSDEDAQRLSNAIAGSQSVFHAQSYPHVHKVTESSPSRGFGHAAIIEKAIEEGKQISFQYLSYDKDGFLKPGRGGIRIKINPYFIFAYEGVFYLFSNQAKYKNTSRYRLDRMLNIEIEEDAITPLESIDPSFNLGSYLKQASFPSEGESLKGDFLLSSGKLLEEVSRFFPQGFSIESREDGLHALVSASLEQLCSFALLQGEKLTLLGPIEAVDRLHELLLASQKRYLKGKEKKNGQ